jgi:hypothetical protein
MAFSLGPFSFSWELLEEVSFMQPDKTHKQNNTAHTMGFFMKASG